MSRNTFKRPGETRLFKLLAICLLLPILPLLTSLLSSLAYNLAIYADNQGSTLLKDEMATVMLADLLMATEQDAPYKWSLLRRIWTLNQLAVVDTMIHLYNKSSELLSSILAACQQLGALEAILNLVPYTLFASDLSVLASNTPSAPGSSTTLLDLNEWIRSTISAHSDVFARSILQYIHTTRKFGASATSDMITVAAEKRGSSARPAASPPVSTISDATISSLLAAIKASDDILSAEAREELSLLLPAGDEDDTLAATTAQAALLALSDDSLTLSAVNAASLARFGGTGSNLAASSNSTGEVEMTADSYFQQLYEEKITPAEFLEVCATLKASTNASDRQVFSCMVNNVFAEYSFFSNYPEKELMLTSRIFGGLIQNTLVEGDMLNSALNAILAAVSIPPAPTGSTGDMFAFGIQALSAIASSRLAPYPKYAATVLEVPHFSANAPASLVATLRLVASLANATNVQPRNPIGGSAQPLVPTPLPRNPTALPSTIPPVHQAPSGSSKNSSTSSRNRGGGGGGGGQDKNDRGGQDKGSSSGGSSGGSGSSSSAGGAGGSAPPPGGPPGGGPPDDGHNHRNSTTGAPQLNVSTREMVQPDEDTTDRIHFILNNVSPSNMTQKSDDLAKVLKPQFFDYFASHLVSNRVSTDTRFQGLYLELIDRQNSSDLFSKVLKTTYRAVHEILNSPKLTQSTERSWLKNLGTWLGSLTLARNRPVMHVDLAVKELILKAYEQGTLHAVLPFVSKILQGAVDSKVFRVPNPWFVAILRLLKEIHAHPRSQQNIRFEIEILFQKIDEDLPSMPPSELLLQHTMYNGPSMKDFVVDNSAGSTAPGSSAASSSAPSLATPGVAPHVPGTTNWMPTLILSPDHIFMHQPALKQRLHHAFNKAIDDLVPEAEVTVSIVPKTTLRLVLKDFANEPDENKVLMAARSMAQSLASSLLHATLRNHIRTATHNTMKSSAELKQQYESYQAQFHRAIDDNLEVACSVLAKHLVEKTLLAVEHELRPHLEQRSLHRDQLSRNLTNRPFSDQSQIAPQQQALPDALKVRPGTGASAPQTALYDVFLRLSSLIQASIDAANLHQQAAAVAAQAQQVSQAAAAALAAQPAGSTNAPSGGAIGSSTAGMTPIDPSKVLGGPSSHSLSSSGGVPMSSGGLQHKETHQLDTKRAVEKLEAMIAEHERWAQSIETGSLETAADAQHALAALQRLPITILRETQDRVAVATTVALRVFDLMYTNSRANTTAAAPQSLVPGSASTTSAGNASAAEENPLREMYARIMFSIARSTPVVAEALTQRYLQVNAGEATISTAQGTTVTLEPYHRELTYALLTWQLLRADMIDPALASEISKVGTSGSQKAIDFSMWLIKCTVLGTHDASGSPSASGGNSAASSTSASPAPGSAVVGSGISQLNGQHQQQHTSVNLLAGSDLPRTLAELESAMARSRSSDIVVVQSCAALPLDNSNMQSRRVATHTDHLQSSMVAGGPKRTGASAVGSSVVGSGSNASSASASAGSFGSGASGTAASSANAAASAASSSSAQQRQQHLMLRQQSLAKLLPQPVVTIFSEWVSLWQHGTPAIEPMQQVLLALRNLRFVSFGDVALVEPETHFLRGVIDAAVLAYLMQSQMQAIAQANLQPGVEPTPEQATYLAIQPYAAIDALTKLIVFLVKNYPENARHLLLQRVLIQTSASTLVDYASNVAEFNQRPYFRLLSSLLVHISDPIFGEKLESLFLSSFADVLVELRPQQCPGFAFAWLELLSHRLFLPKLIRHPRALFALHKLLIFHLTFLEPYLASAKLNDAVSALYQGTLRVFLVLIHDFPEFLCDFHHSFCDVLPPTCIQLRNLILSAFPRNIKLPDPALNIKMDQLPASKESPRVYNIDAELTNQGLRERVEEALKAGASIAPNSVPPQQQIAGPGGSSIAMAPLPSAAQGALDALFAALPNALFHKDTATGKQTTYNVKFINSLVLVVGVAAISAPHNRVPMDIFMHLANMLDAEGRYHLFNAFANQLRFPSSHTQYFSWALLHIFAEAQNDAIPEQITRVLLERYIAQKPTPWGLAITYQELTKNQAYNFWTRDFIKASPDIGRLFMNLSRRSANQR